MKIFIPIILVLTVAGTYGCETYPVFTSGSIEAKSSNLGIKLIFSDYDRHLIHEYYGNTKRKKIPPGLAKKKHLPPGLQKQIRKNGKLPPGLEGGNLPYELERKLTSLPENYLRIRVGTDIVLMDGRTRLILDVINEVPL